MKNVTVARKLIGFAAVFVAIGAAGCSADTGSQGSEAVGSASAALTNADVSASLAAPGVAHAFGQSCVISDGTHTYVLAVGGESASATLTDHVDVYLPGAPGTWTAATTNTLAKVERGKMITDPANAARCIQFGGITDPTLLTKTDKIVSYTLTVSGGVPSIAVAQAGKLSSVREFPVVLPCDGNILIAGGKDGSGATDLMEVWDTSFLAGSNTINTFKNTNASPAQVKMNTARRDFAGDTATDESGSKDGIVFGGGVDGSLSTSSTLEAVRTNGSCKLDDNSVASPSIAHPFDLTSLASTAQLGTNSGTPDPRFALVAYYAGSNVFHFVAGNNGAASPNHDLITLNWTTLSSSSGVPGTALQTGTVAPTLIKLGLAASPATDVVVIGGKTAAGVSIADFQEINGSTTTKTTTDVNSVALDPRAGVLGEYVSDAYAVSGFKSQTTATWLTDTRKVR